MRLFLSSLLLNLPLLASSSAFDIAKFVQYPAANYGSSFVSDGSGNLYISDEDSLERWSSATGTLTNPG